MKAASGEYVVIIDADLQHPPRLIKDMYYGITKEGYDSVVAYRIDRKGENKIRYFFSKIFFKLASKITELSSREEDAILKHMWPLYRGIPKYKESYAVTLADKYAATLEIGYQWSNTAAKKIVSLVSSII